MAALSGSVVVGQQDLAIAIHGGIKAEPSTSRRCGIVTRFDPGDGMAGDLNKGRAIFSAVARVHDGLDSASNKIAGERV